MKKAKSRNGGSADKQGSAAPTLVGPSSSKRQCLLVILCLAVSGGATYFVLTTYVLVKLPDSIVGAWRVESGEMKGDTMTFHRDGTFTAMVRTHDGSVAPVKARVELRDETLRYIFEMPGAGRQERTQTIKSLTPTEMIVQEGSGTCKLVRIE